MKKEEIKQKIEEILYGKGYIEPQCQFISSMVMSLLSQYESERDEELVNVLEGYDKKQHVCRFNDGKQNCDCYYEAFNKASQIIKETQK